MSENVAKNELLTPLVKANNNDRTAEQRSQSLQRFRVVATVIKALNRWQAALNPTYVYTKDAKESAFEKRKQVIAQARTMSQQVYGNPRAFTNVRAASGRTASGRPAAPGTHYGHKGNMLFKPLPDPEATSAS